MDTMRRLLEYILPVLLLASNGQAAPADAPVLFPGNLDATAFPQITFRLNVRSAALQFRGALSTADVALTEGGAPASGVTLTALTAPLRLGLVVDNSASMQPIRLPVLRSIAAFLKRLPANARVTVITFGEAAKVAVESTADRPTVLKGLKNLAPERASALLDGVKRGIEELRSEPDLRRVLVITDGSDEGETPGTRQSYATPKDVAALAHNAGVPVHAVCLGARAHAPLMRKLAQLSGGSFTAAADVQGLPEALGAALADLSQEYQLSFTSPRPAPDGLPRQVALTVAGSAPAQLRYESPAAPKALVKASEIPIQPWTAFETPVDASPGKDAWVRVPDAEVNDASGEYLLASVQPDGSSKFFQRGRLRKRRSHFEGRVQVPAGRYVFVLPRADAPADQLDWAKIKGDFEVPEKQIHRQFDVDARSGSRWIYRCRNSTLEPDAGVVSDAALASNQKLEATFSIPATEPQLLSAEKYVAMLYQDAKGNAHFTDWLTCRDKGERLSPGSYLVVFVRPGTQSKLFNDLKLGRVKFNPAGPYVISSYQVLLESNQDYAFTVKGGLVKLSD